MTPVAGRAVGRAVEPGWTTVWARRGSAVDGAVDPGALRWTTRRPSAPHPVPLWNAVDGCGRPAPALTCADGGLSTFHSHPYDNDLDVNPVGEPRTTAPTARRHDLPLHPCRESEPRR